MVQGGNNQNLKEIRTLEIDIIAHIRNRHNCDRRTTDEFRFHGFC